MKEQITIIGDGAMGLVCAMILSRNGHDVTLWTAFPEAVEELRRLRGNPRRLPDAALSAGVSITADDATCFAGATLAVSAVPGQYVRSVWKRLQPHVPPELPIVSITKGIENQTLMRPSQIIAQVLDGSADAPRRPLAVLSGPNIAGELARRLPATAVAAGSDQAVARRVQQAFTNAEYRVYTNTDCIGVELAGAMKNVIALAAGIVDGLGLGDNAKAALVTRGLVEIARLGMAMGAKEATFNGLTGLGDLITTCTSPEGRNRRVGEMLGKGMKLPNILASMDSVVEGVPTTQSVMQLARQYNVEMPITAAVSSILFENVTPRDALTQLMTREHRAEA